MVPTMQFIDFEYGAYAARGYDWGNHFNEYAGFECDYARYPDSVRVSAFVRAYLTEGAEVPPVSKHTPQAGMLLLHVYHPNRLQLHRGTYLVLIGLHLRFLPAFLVRHAWVTSV